MKLEASHSFDDTDDVQRDKVAHYTSTLSLHDSGQTSKIEVTIDSTDPIDMVWLLLLGSALAALILRNLISLLANYQSARQIGLPIIISPIFSLNPFWILLHRCTPILPFLKSLPFHLGKWARCNYIGWQFAEKHALHKELGDAFLLVSPSKIELMVADADAVNVILGRRKEYIKPAMMYGTFDLYLPSSTV